MYDIKEVAKKLKISESATYRKLKSKEVQKFMFKKDNKTYISKDGYEFLNTKKAKVKTVHKEVNIDDFKNDSNTYAISVLNNTIELLKEEMKIKNEQMRTKDEQITSLTDLNKNAQVLMKEQQNKVIMLEEETQKPWWEKIFSKKRSYR